MKQFLKSVVLGGLRALLGVKLIDQRTGKVIGKVLVLPWRGGLRMIGLDGVPVRASFRPQLREVYWAQDLVFSTHEPPDFPSVAHVESDHRSDLPPNALRGGSDVRDVANP